MTAKTKHPPEPSPTLRDSSRAQKRAIELYEKRLAANPEADETVWLECCRQARAELEAKP